MKRFEQLMRSGIMKIFLLYLFLFCFFMLIIPLIETPAYTTWNSTIAEHDSATNKTAKKEKSKSRIRDHNSSIKIYFLTFIFNFYFLTLFLVLVSSEPIKKQDSAVHGR